MLRYLSKNSLRGRRVLLRVDFNVPIAGQRVGGEYDILRVLPTIRGLLRQRNILILLSHHSNDRQSLAPLRPLLARRLNRPVGFIKNPLSVSARTLIRRARPGALFLVENLRFWPGEKNNSPKFSRALAGLGEVFINDAFGELHRPYASMVGLPRFLPSCAGPLIKNEFKMLDKFINQPRRPLVAIFGGAKIKTKLAILRRFIRLADKVLVGGALANILLKARGFEVGRSMADGKVRGVAQLVRSKKLFLPVDAVAARDSRRGRTRAVPIRSLDKRDVIYDIGPKTQVLFRRLIKLGQTLIWNGPMGLAEKKKFSRGTSAVARALAQKRGHVLIGGGDTAAFIMRAGLLKKFKYVSTGGGAMLAYLAGEKLPGLEAIKKSKFP